MANSFNAPRMGLGLSEERRATLQRENRLKQELYAQQKKIQFSNLLERSNQDVDAYIETQNNVFIPHRNVDSDFQDERSSYQAGSAENAPTQRNRTTSTAAISSRASSIYRKTERFPDVAPKRFLWTTTRN